MTFRQRIDRLLAHATKKVFPDHWSFLLGEVAMAAMVVLFTSGLILAFFYDASGEATTYDGSYEALHDIEMSRAYESVLQLSFDVPAGLLVRQVHHWAALVFVAAIAVHATRIFLTGAYRRPRRLNYFIGVTLLLLSLTNGFFGVSLPDDLLSASGVRIGYALALSVPVVGPGITELLFGGELPSEEMVNRFWLLHVFVVPSTIIGLFSVHMILVWRQTHTQYPSDGSADRVVGSRLLPHHMMKTTAVFGCVAAVLVGLGALVQVNPLWIYGPNTAAAATVPAGPDWYLMFVEGALRVLPALHLDLGPVEVPSPFVVAVGMPGLLFGGLYLWPFLEERVTRDKDIHHLLERPRDRPVRTGLGAFTLTALGVLTLAANHDYLGGLVGADVVTMTTAFRVLLITLPPLAGFVAWRLARDLRAPDITSAARRRADAPPDESTGDRAILQPDPRRWGVLLLAIGGSLVAAGIAALRHRRSRSWRLDAEGRS